MPELTSLKSVKLDAPGAVAGPSSKAPGEEGDDSDEEGRDEGEFAPGGDADYFTEEVRQSCLGCYGLGTK